MIDSVAIDNFKCFKGAGADGISRVGVVVGDNASGKTALLEALFLVAGGSPELVFRSRKWRGVQASISSGRNALKEIIEDTFYDFDTADSVSIRVVDSNVGSRAIKIEFGGGDELLLPLNDADEQTSSSEGRLTFRWFKNDNLLHESEAKIKDKGISYSNTADIYLGALISVGVLPGVETAARFSSLSKARTVSKVLQPMQAIFPFIRGISIEADGGAPVLYADIDHVSRKVPLGLLSFGIHRMLHILLTLVDIAGGVLLIDEVDTGIHHSKLSTFLSVLTHTAQEHDVQVFATTHSSECLRSFLPSVRKNPEQFSLLRLKRGDNGSKILTFPGKNFEAALLENVEIR